LLPEDPKEIFIAINELVYNIHIKDCINACYWIEWILEFETACNANKQKITCERRLNIPVDPKDQKNIIWIVWSALLAEAVAKKRPKIIKIIMESLLFLFTLKYSSGCVKRRKFILYVAVSLLTENVRLKEEILKDCDEYKLAIVLSKINVVYRQIKGNERTGNLDYLFMGTKNKAYDKTISKIEMMNTFTTNLLDKSKRDGDGDGDGDSDNSLDDGYDGYKCDKTDEF
jgi:hypothetical protein